MAATIKEIAMRVGVSIASVSLYLNNRDTKRVSAATKEKIDLAAHELNYRKNIFASSLSRHASKIIGVIIPTPLPLFVNEFTNAILAGIQQVLSKGSYSLLFLPVNGTSSVEIVKDQLQNSEGCDGYFLFSTGFCSLDQVHNNIETLRKTGKPFVTINIPELDLPVNQVILEDLDTARGGACLLEQGHRDILLLLGRENDMNTANVKKSFLELNEQRSLTVKGENIRYGDYLAETACRVVKNRLLNGGPLTAICCMSDQMALGAYAAVQELGYRIPEDISIMGRNNTNFSPFLYPSLTTVDLHMTDAGINAAELLLDVVGGVTFSGGHKKIKLRSTVVYRDSLGSLEP